MSQTVDTSVVLWDRKSSLTMPEDYHLQFITGDDEGKVQSEYNAFISSDEVAEIYIDKGVYVPIGGKYIITLFYTKSK